MALENDHLSASDIVLTNELPSCLGPYRGNDGIILLEGKLLQKLKQAPLGFTALQIDEDKGDLVWHLDRRTRAPVKDLA